MTVSFIIIAYNEGNTLQSILRDVQRQDYPHEKIEILLVDGISTDNTKNIMCEFAKEEKSFLRIEILDNPKKTLPCGWNVALEEARNDIILRVDAHSSIPTDFISKNVSCIMSGEKICGGYRPNIIDEDTPWKQTLLMAESSMFGSSIAPYRRNNGRRYVNSVFHGAYCKEVFDKVGNYNEQLSRTEDNEMHYRMRQAGYKICFDPNIISYQHTRNTLKKMLRQKYLNGYWIGRTVKVCPGCLAIYHFIPCCFVLGIIVTTILAICHFPLLAILMWFCYWVLAIVNSVISMISNKKCYIQSLLLPILFFALHVSYGIGSILGLCKS